MPERGSTGSFEPSANPFYGAYLGMASRNCHVVAINPALLTRYQNTICLRLWRSHRIFWMAC
jgi:hypothetical protein